MAMAESSWMMLDRFVFHRDDGEEGSPFLDESKAPLRESCCTSLGKRFDILLRLAEPPAISRFYMRWPNGTESENAKGTELVAAHRELLLFRHTSFGRLGMDDHVGITQDHFICIASFKTKPCLQLKLLPVCNEPMVYPFGEGDEKEVSEQRVFLSDTVGLARRSDTFAVAQLAMVRPVPHTLMMEAEVCVLRSRVSGNDGDGKWFASTIPIQHKEDEYKELWYWSTDAVVTFENYICWINYYRGGMLVYDVLEEKEKAKILYIRMPIVDRPRSSAQGRAFYEMNRSVCATTDITKKRRPGAGAHVLIFTDVIRSDGELFGPLRQGSGFTIRSYTLSSLHWSWSEHVAITSEELWALDTSKALPRDILMFPLVSMKDFNIACFLVSGSAEEENSKVSLVTIELSTKHVLAVDPYISSTKGSPSGPDDPYISSEKGCPSGPDADMIEEKSHLLRSFIASKFPMYLTEGLTPTLKNRD